jgi:4a-hydroxytetrahydrobiopterin dehydratase
MQPLTEQDILTALRDLPGWRYEQGSLAWNHNFGDFRTAVAFIVAMSFEAEALDHHPELHNVCGRVQLRLTTHDAQNQVTGRDVALAKAVLGVLQRFR